MSSTLALSLDVLRHKSAPAISHGGKRRPGRDPSPLELSGTLNWADGTVLTPAACGLGTAVVEYRYPVGGSPGPPCLGGRWRAGDYARSGGTTWPGVNTAGTDNCGARSRSLRTTRW